MTPGSGGIAPGIQELIALREQARRIDLAPRGRLLATRAGGHLSRFRGRGMEFDESRVYQPGDDPRHMDWRVTARAGVPHVKLFREERERPVWLLIDQGASMRFGTRVTFKSTVAAQAAALLGWAAVDRGDRVGGLAFDETRHLERRPAARAAGLLPLLDRLASEPDPGAGRDGRSLDQAAVQLARLARPGSLAILISDFATLDADSAHWMAALSAGSEVMLVAIHDPLEVRAPPPGRYPVLAGMRRILLDTGDDRLCRDWQSRFEQRRARLTGLARRFRAHLLALATDRPVGPALAEGLGRRPPCPPPGGAR